MHRALSWLLLLVLASVCLAPAVHGLPFKKVEGNIVADGGFDVEPTYYAAWFARTSQATSRFSAEEWRAIAPPATGSAVKPDVGMAMDWRTAAKLIPKNPQVKGARPQNLERESLI